MKKIVSYKIMIVIALILQPTIVFGTLHRGRGIVEDVTHFNFGTGDIFYSYSSIESGYFYGSSLSNPTLYFGDIVSPSPCNSDSDGYRGVSTIQEFTSADDHVFTTQHAIKFGDTISSCYQGILLFRQNGLYGGIEPIDVDYNQVLHYRWWYDDSGGSDFSDWSLPTTTTTLSTTPPEWSEMSSGTSAFLNGVWGSSGNDIFAVGENGTILHYNGSDWTTMNSGTTERLYDVWGSSGSDVFVVGSSGTILHYNGSSWSSMESGTSYWIFEVWGSSGSDVFAVSELSTILHFNGSDWTTMSNETSAMLLGVWGSSGDDVFAVGSVYYDASGIIFHYDGSIWSEMNSGVSARPLGVWGSSESDVFVVGEMDTILHYNGSDWASMSIGTSSDLYGIWGNSLTNIFAVGYSGTILHYNGLSWSSMESGTSEWLHDIWGISRGDVFAVGANGTILHYDSAICLSKLIYGNDSKETEFLRYVRDSILKSTSEGRELIRLYYEWSPVIVKMMEEDEEFKEYVRVMIEAIVPMIKHAME